MEWQQMTKVKFRTKEAKINKRKISPNYSHLVVLRCIQHTAPKFFTVCFVIIKSEDLCGYFRVVVAGHSVLFETRKRTIHEKKNVARDSVSQIWLTKKKQHIHI